MVDFDGVKRRQLLSVFMLAVMVWAGASCERRAKSQSCVKDAVYQRVMRAWKAADHAIAEGRYAEANAALKSEIDSLNYDSALPAGTKDDSGMRAGLAESYERNGDAARASKIRREVLGERLDTYRNAVCRER